MSARPTIEQRMRAGRLILDREDAIRIAREYAAERTEPLVAVLQNLLATPAVRSLGIAACVEDARAALAAEAEARKLTS